MYPVPSYIISKDEIKEASKIKPSSTYTICKTAATRAGKFTLERERGCADSKIFTITAAHMTICEEKFINLESTIHKIQYY